MPRGLSAYLDLLRVLAALQVVAYHLSWPRFSALDRTIMFQWGHEAVIVFFVLSGFVVRHAAENRDHSFTDFAISRISRLYSVIIPCLAVTVICDLAGRALAPNLYENIQAPSSGIQVFALTLISLAMLNQSSGYVVYFSNEPYWSLCYEFWYYFLFAAFYYIRGPKRWFAVMLIAYCTGIKALLLLPVWCIGVLSYTEQSSRKWNKKMTWLAFLQPIVIFFIYVTFDFPKISEQFIGPALSKQLVFSNRFISDTFLAISLGLHLSAAKQLDTVLWRALGFAQPLIAAGAARSFTLYLMHQPLMLMLVAISTALLAQPAGWFVVVGTIGVPMLLAPAIENQRHALRAWLSRTLQRLQTLRARAQLTSPAS